MRLFFRWIALIGGGLLLGVALGHAVAAVPYAHVQATANVSAAPHSRFVTLTVHLRNVGGIATACTVRASGQQRVTGLSAQGDAEVTFDSLREYRGYTVVCQVN